MPTVPVVSSSDPNLYRSIKVQGGRGLSIPSLPEATGQMGIVNRAAGAEAEALVQLGHVTSESAMHVGRLLADARAKEVENRLRDEATAAENEALDLGQQYRSLRGNEAEGGPERIAMGLNKLAANSKERLAKYGKEAVDKFDLHFSAVRGNVLRSAAEHWAGEDRALREDGLKADAMLALRKVETSDLAGVEQAVVAFSDAADSRFPGDDRRVEKMTVASKAVDIYLQKVALEQPEKYADTVAGVMNSKVLNGAATTEMVEQNRRLALANQKQQETGVLVADLLAEFGSDLDGAIEKSSSESFIREHGLESVTKVFNFLQAKEREQKENIDRARILGGTKEIDDLNAMLVNGLFSDVVTSAQKATFISAAQKKSYIAGATAATNKEKVATKKLEEKSHYVAIKNKILLGELKGHGGLLALVGEAENVSPEDYGQLVNDFQEAEKARVEKPDKINFFEDAVNNYSVAGDARIAFIAILDSIRKEKGLSIYSSELLAIGTKLSEQIPLARGWFTIDKDQSLAQYLYTLKTNLDSGGYEQAKAREGLATFRTPTPKEYASNEELQAAVKAREITAVAARAYAKKKGWAK